VTSILIELLGTAIERGELFRAEVTAKVVVAGLTVLLVLTPQVWDRRVSKNSHIAVPLTKLLKGKATMPEDLCAYITGSINLDAGRGHLKGGPMLMLDQVTKKPFGALVFFLTFGVTDPGTVDNGVFGVRRDPDEPCRGSGHNGGEGGSESCE
jgi:hypothetical protein